MHRRCIWTLVAMLSLSLAAGCVDNDMSVVIAFNAAPDPSSCECTNTGPGDTASMYSSGLADLTYLPTDPDTPYPYYDLHLQVYNYMLNNAVDDIEKLDSMGVWLTKARIRYEWDDPLDHLANSQALFVEEFPYDQPIISYIGSAATPDDPGMLLKILGVLPVAITPWLTGLAADVDLNQVALIVKVRLIGKTQGGIRVESNEFMFPIYFCDGCHICPAGEVSTACIPGQDSFTCEPEESS